MNGSIRPGSRFRALLLGLAACLALASTAQAGADSVFVLGDYRIHRYNGDLTGTVTSYSLLPSYSRSMLKHPTQSLLYVAVQGGGNSAAVLIYNLADMAAAPIEIPMSGYADLLYRMNFSVDGSRLYVPLGSQIVVIDTSSSDPTDHHIIASFFAPETIRSVVPNAGKSALFLGATGSVYVYGIDDCTQSYTFLQQLPAVGAVESLVLNVANDEVFGSDRGAPSFVIKRSESSPGEFEKSDLLDWPGSAYRSWRGDIFAEGRRYIGADTSHESAKTALVFDALAGSYMANVTVPARFSYKYSLGIASNPTDSTEGYIGQAWCWPVKLFHVRLVDVGLQSEALQLTGTPSSISLPEDAKAIVVVP